MMDATHRPPPHILLVEDNPDDRYFIQKALQSQQHAPNVHVAKDGIEALHFLRQDDPHTDAPRPSLIILDLKLPKMSGLEVLQAIKADKALRSIPVIVLTTSDATDDAADSYDLQATSFITKPKDLDEFKRVMERIEKFWFQIAQLPPSH